MKEMLNCNKMTSDPWADERQGLRDNPQAGGRENQQRETCEHAGTEEQKMSKE